MPNSEEVTPQRSDDEAPEVVSNSASKIQALEIKKKERGVKQKYALFTCLYYKKISSDLIKKSRTYAVLLKLFFFIISLSFKVTGT